MRDIDHTVEICVLIFLSYSVTGTILVDAHLKLLAGHVAISLPFNVLSAI